MPSFLIRLDEFPLTNNGKIDKKALIAPEKIDIGTDLLKPGNEIEKRILDVFKQVIGIENLGVNSGFFDAGGTSMKAIFAEAHLSKELDVSVEHFYQYRSIQEIAKNVTWKKNSLKEKIREVKMEPTRAEPGAKGVVKTLTDEIEKEYNAYVQQIQTQILPDLSTVNDYRHIFLSGATGYLGAHLVYEFLHTTDTQLHLLVRGDTPEDAIGYLKQSLDFYFGENFYENNSRRLQVVAGDLRGEELGIDDSLYSELCRNMDAVVHAASNTMEFGLYEDFYKVNVLGTENLLELAEKGKKKDFHYISTMEVAHGDIETGQAVLFTELCHDVDQVLSDYTRSYWEAEKKVLARRESGMNISIYRVGNLTFHSDTGKTRVNIEKDIFVAQMEAFITLGKMPDLKNTLHDLSFVNQTAAAVIKLLTRENTKNRTYHLYNHNRLTWDQTALLMEKAGIPVQVVSPGEFLDYLSACIDGDKNIPVIVRLMRHAGLFKKTSRQRNRALVRVVNDSTLNMLRQVGFQWEKVDESHIEKMVRYGQQVGFIKRGTDEK
jgi:thioester reductase-like protein